MKNVPQKFKNALAHWREVWEHAGCSPGFTSSLKDSGESCGIAWGDEMGEFVKWATDKILGKERARKIAEYNS